MKSTTLSFDKMICKIQDLGFTSIVSSHKYSELKNLVSGIESFTVTGCIKQSKLEKYQSVLSGCGFSVSKVYWIENAGFEGENSDVVNIRIEYSK